MTKIAVAARLRHLLVVLGSCSMANYCTAPACSLHAGDGARPTTLTRHPAATRIARHSCARFCVPRLIHRYTILNVLAFHLFLLHVGWVPAVQLLAITFQRGKKKKKKNQTSTGTVEDHPHPCPHSLPTPYPHPTPSSTTTTQDPPHPPTHQAPHSSHYTRTVYTFLHL